MLLQSVVFFLGFLILVFFVIPFGNFSDSADHILGGCLIIQGQEIYVDFFSHHMPMLYYIGALAKIISGDCAIITSRMFIGLAMMINLLFVYRISRDWILPITLYLFLTAMSMQWYSFHLLAESLAFLAGLPGWIIITKRIPINNVYRIALFALIEFILLGASPMFFFAAIFLFFVVAWRQRNRHQSWIHSLFFHGIIAFIPSFIFLLITSDLQAFWDQVINFNIKYYGPFTAAETSLGPIQNTLHILQDFNTINPLAWLKDMHIMLGLIEGTIIVSWIIFNILSNRSHCNRRNHLIEIIYILLFTLRMGNFHSLPAITLMIASIIFNMRLTDKRLKKFLIFPAILVFIIGIKSFYSTYRFNLNPSKTTSEKIIDIVNRYSKSKEKIIVYPVHFEVYLKTQRQPGSFYYFMTPWIANRKKSLEKIQNDIFTQQPQLIIFDMSQIIFNKFEFKSYAQNIINNVKMNPKYKRLDLKDKNLIVFKYES